MPPVRIGIVGSGAIAQVHHLPNLVALREEFSVEVLCDLSLALAQSVAQSAERPVTDVATGEGVEVATRPVARVHAAAFARRLLFQFAARIYLSSALPA